MLTHFLLQSPSPEILAELERHLRDCAPCVVHLETCRKTVELTGRAEHVEMPEEMTARLRSLLLNELRLGQS